RLARQRKQILFVKINADGFDLGATRHPAESNDLPEAERLIHAWFVGNLDELQVTRLSCTLVEKSELLANKDVTLNVERYMDNSDATHGYEIVTINEICVDVQS